MAAAALAVSAPLLVGAGPASHPLPVTPWQAAAPVPTPRTEVAAALVAGEIAVAGGYLADGSTTGSVEAYSPTRNEWRRLPDLPVAVNHAMATAYRGRLYVVGGYPGFRKPLREAFVLDGGRWQRLPRPPEGRAAGGAAFLNGKLYVVGGVGPAGLGLDTLVYDPAKRRWSTAPGPVPREHLAATTFRGRIYALGGRRAGYDTNVALNESWAPGARRWTRLPGIPRARGGTGAAVFGDVILSIGGEEPRGTIATVYAYEPVSRRWGQFPDLRTPRHGLGVVAAFGRVYALAGGPEPGLTVSEANEFLSLES